MNVNDEHEKLTDSDFYGDILDEYKTKYAALSPDAKHEADVQRALRIIDLFMGSESMSSELHFRFLDWFLEYGERRHVAEAFGRYFGENPTTKETAAKSAKTICLEYL